MAKAPAFQFYPADWLADANVMVMSSAQEGAYIRAICLCWREGYLPADTDRLRKMLSKPDSQLTDEDLRVVQFCFNQHPTDGTKMVHFRLENERYNQAEWASKSSAGGKKSALVRAEKRRKELEFKGGSNALATRVNTSSSSSSSSSEEKIRGTHKMVETAAGGNPPSLQLLPPPADGNTSTQGNNGARQGKTNTPPSPRRSHFIKPTLEQVTEYLLEINSPIDPEGWIDSQEAKGWLIGKTKTPMQDWKATIRTWERNRKADSKAQAATRTRSAFV